MSTKLARNYNRVRFTSNGAVELRSESNIKAVGNKFFIWFWKIMTFLALIYFVIILPCIEYGIIKL